MKRGIALVSLACAAFVMAGCQKPETKPAASAPAPAPAQQAPAEVAKSKLPVTGIGATITTTVKAKEAYTIACIVKNLDQPLYGETPRRRHESRRRHGLQSRRHGPRHQRQC